MENINFEHKVSKGGRFNQIYIPKEMEAVFEVGDIVEVSLLKKKEQLYYSKNLKKVSEFKEKLSREIFSSLLTFPEIKQIFVFGSFLIEKIDYNDIDLLIILEKKEQNIEEKIYNHLIKEFQLKFHIISIPEDIFYNLIKICPLTRSMLHYYISNKKFETLLDKVLDKNHIKFLLMMPEDLLKIRMSSRVFYDNIRRLMTVKKFLENKDLDPIKINLELKSLLKNEFMYSQLKDNEEIDRETLGYLRNIIKRELNKIKKKL